MKKTGCKAAILILLAVLVLSGQAFAGRGGGRGRKRGRRLDRDVPDRPRMGARAGAKRPSRAGMGKGLYCPFCQRPCVWGQGLQGRGMMGGRGQGFLGRGLGPCGQGLGRIGMMMQGRGMMGKWGGGFQQGMGGPCPNLSCPLADGKPCPLMTPEDWDQPGPPMMGRRGQGFQGRGMGRPGPGGPPEGMGRPGRGGPPEGMERPGRGGPPEDMERPGRGGPRE